jgi:ribosomal protein L7/L12
MRRIVVTGRNIVFQKVEFTKTLKLELGCSLSEAKGMTDAVVDRKPIQVDLPEEQFDRVSDRFSKLGAVFHEEGR